MGSHLKNFHQIGKKIVCVGRNYFEHAKELNNPVPKIPLLFSKTTNSYLTENEGGKIQTPYNCKNLHYEVELGVVIGKKATKINKNNAFEYVGGYAIALDMTARDIQNELKKKGEPWFIAKSFDTSCPIGKFVDKKQIEEPQNIEIYCKINNEYRQKGSTKEMIFDIPTLLEYITKYATLEEGDLVLTGTPAGVGQCNSGDKIEIGITNITSSNFIVE